MKYSIRAITVTALACLCCLTTFTQTSTDTSGTSLVLQQGVLPHEGLDQVYRRFSEGYKKLDAQSVAELYTETAAYLVPGKEIQIGRAKIAESFSSFFDSVRQQEGRLEISFRILQRQVDKNIAYDVGIYTLTSFNNKNESRRSSGKFVVVAKREKGNLWRFQVDGYSGLPK